MPYRDPEQKKAHGRRYAKTTESKARTARYNQTPAGKDRMARYHEGPKGTASQALSDAKRESGTLRILRQSLHLLDHSVSHPVVARRILVLSDIQFPFQDRPVMEAVYTFAKRWKPDTLIVNGDLIDCYVLSDFLKDPLMAEATRRLEKSEVAEFFQQLAYIPTKIWLGGNHEDRYRKVLWRALNARSAETNAMIQDVLDLGEIHSADDLIRNLFRVAELGVEYWPYGDRVVLADGKLIVTHGFKLSQMSAYSARMHLARLGKSVLIGHSHRQGVYRESNLNGTLGAWENGCLCRLDPEYVQFPNWQQGFSVITVDQGQFHVEQIPILPGPSINHPVMLK